MTKTARERIREIATEKYAEEPFSGAASKVVNPTDQRAVIDYLEELSERVRYLESMVAGLDEDVDPYAPSVVKDLRQRVEALESRGRLVE